jgi:long-chain acyl-CoA synthetase
MSPGLCLSDVVDRRWAEEASHPAIRQGDDGLTFGELLQWSQRISRSLQRVVREPGQRVALMMANSAAFVASFFAIARLGGVVAPLSPRYRSQEARHYLGDLDAVALLTEPHASGPPDIPEGEPRLAVVEVSRAEGARMVRPGGDGAPSLRLGGSPPLLQQYTSGSTGRPKRVIRSHANLLAELEALRQTFDVNTGDRFLGAAPFSHVNGLVRTMMTAMYVGATLYPVEAFHRRGILNVLTREHITVFGGVPHMFVILSQTPPREPVDLSALRIVFSSSAPLTAADNREFRARYGTVIRQLYGSTETGTISFNGHSRPEDRPTSVGTPLPGVRVEVLDDQGRALPAGREGQLAVASPFATGEYAGHPEATAESFRGGWYLTGDLGAADREGFITLTGRCKLAINRGGFKVNPYEVEVAIREHPGVADVAVLGLPGGHGDDIVCAVIVALGALPAEEVVAHCRDRIADYKIPTTIEFRRALPRSPTGKILRDDLRREIVEAKPRT